MKKSVSSGPKYMTKSFSEIIICRCVPALDSDGSAAESPSNKERDSFMWDVKHSRNEKLERIFVYVQVIKIVSV